MILAGGKLGHPWHGLWKASNNKIVGANDVLLDLPGVAPVGRGESKEGAGECFMVAVPGMPTVSTSSEDQEAGLAWLNYGLISGANRRFYGVELGVNSWLYVAPDKSVWLARLYSLQNLTGSVLLKRFGEFGVAAQQQSITYSFSGADLGGGADGNRELDIEAVTTDGAKVLLCFCHKPDYPPYYGPARACEGIGEIVISGTPPAASVSVNVKKTATDCAPSDSESSTRYWRRSSWDTAGGTQTPSLIFNDVVAGAQPDMSGMPGDVSESVMVSASGTKSVAEYIWGAYYTSNGTVEYVRVAKSTAFEIALTDVAPRDAQARIDVGGGSATFVTTVTFSIAEFTATWTINQSASCSGGFVGEAEYGESTSALGYTVSGATGSRSWSAAGTQILGVDYGGIYPPSLYPAAPELIVGNVVALGYVNGTNTEYIIRDFRRYCSGVFGATEFSFVKNSDTPPSTWSHLDILSPSGIVSRSVSSDLQYSAFVTRHPVTGDVAFSDTAICFV